MSPGSSRSSITSLDTQVDNHSAQMIPLGLYIWQRIKQCGVGRIFGVPGDFNLALLDYIYQVDGLEWIGSTNELNAAYATDGYARVKGGAGCFVTTHGVGELSAINGVAGSMTEQVKVIHVVGQTSRQMQQDRMMIHHNIGFKPDHQIYNKAASGFRTTAATLLEESTAAEDVDRVLQRCFIESKPVYLYVPMDMVTVPVSSSRLCRALDLTVRGDSEAVQRATHAILEAIYSAKRPCLLVDALVKRHNALSELDTLLDRLHIPTFTTIISKGSVDEDHPNFSGMYNGAISSQAVRNIFESCDLVIVLGNLPTDSNTGGYTRKVEDRATISINVQDVVVRGGPAIPHTPIRSVLASLACNIDPTKVLGVDLPILRPLVQCETTTQITQSWIWPRLAKFFQPGDIVLGETGTASFGLPLTTFPGGVNWITQAYYGSIGFATPAAFGADVARKELECGSRTILVSGDGSMMLTIQEIGNMVKHEASPVIFIINNAGYTIERAIHGAHKSYNDIISFDYSHMLEFFGMPAAQAKQCFHRARTQAEVEAILHNECVVNPTSVQIVELVLDKMDIPWSLAAQMASKSPDAMEEMLASGFVIPEAPQ